ncbi:hypothetical protein D3C75_825520 [compost metagenome]
MMRGKAFLHCILKLLDVGGKVMPTQPLSILSFKCCLIKACIPYQRLPFMLGRKCVVVDHDSVYTNIDTRKRKRPAVILYQLCFFGKLQLVLHPLIIITDRFSVEGKIYPHTHG